MPTSDQDVLPEYLPISMPAYDCTNCNHLTSLLVRYQLQMSNLKREQLQSREKIVEADDLLRICREQTEYIEQKQQAIKEFEQKCHELTVENDNQRIKFESLQRRFNEIHSYAAENQELTRKLEELEEDNRVLKESIVRVAELRQEFSEKFEKSTGIAQKYQKMHTASERKVDQLKTTVDSLKLFKTHCPILLRIVMDMSFILEKHGHMSTSLRRRIFRYKNEKELRETILNESTEWKSCEPEVNVVMSESDTDEAAKGYEDMLLSLLDVNETASRTGEDEETEKRKETVSVMEKNCESCSATSSARSEKVVQKTRPSRTRNCPVRFLASAQGSKKPHTDSKALDKIHGDYLARLSSTFTEVDGRGQPLARTIHGRKTRSVREMQAEMIVKQRKDREIRVERVAKNNVEAQLRAAVHPAQNSDPPKCPIIDIEKINVAASEMELDTSVERSSDSQNPEYIANLQNASDDFDIDPVIDISNRSSTTFCSSQQKFQYDLERSAQTDVQEANDTPELLLTDLFLSPSSSPVKTIQECRETIRTSPVEGTSDDLHSLLGLALSRSPSPQANSATEADKFDSEEFHSSYASLLVKENEIQADDDETELYSSISDPVRAPNTFDQSPTAAKCCSKLICSEEQPSSIPSANEDVNIHISDDDDQLDAGFCDQSGNTCPDAKHVSDHQLRIISDIQRRSNTEVRRELTIEPSRTSTDIEATIISNAPEPSASTLEQCSARLKTERNKSFISTNENNQQRIGNFLSNAEVSAFEAVALNMPSADDFNSESTSLKAHISNAASDDASAAKIVSEAARKGRWQESRQKRFQQSVTSIRSNESVSLNTSRRPTRPVMPLRKLRSNISTIEISTPSPNVNSKLIRSPKSEVPFHEHISNSSSNANSIDIELTRACEVPHLFIAALSNSCRSFDIPETFGCVPVVANNIPTPTRSERSDVRRQQRRQRSDSTHDVLHTSSGVKRRRYNVSINTPSISNVDSESGCEDQSMLPLLKSALNSNFSSPDATCESINAVQKPTRASISSGNGLSKTIDFSSSSRVEESEVSVRDHKLELTSNATSKEGISGSATKIYTRPKIYSLKRGSNSIKKVDSSSVRNVVSESVCKKQQTVSRRKPVLRSISGSIGIASDLINAYPEPTRPMISSRKRSSDKDSKMSSVIQSIVEPKGNCAEKEQELQNSTGFSNGDRGIFPDSNVVTSKTFAKVNLDLPRRKCVRRYSKAPITTKKIKRSALVIDESGLEMDGTSAEDVGGGRDAHFTSSTISDSNDFAGAALVDDALNSEQLNVERNSTQKFPHVIASNNINGAGVSNDTPLCIDYAFDAYVDGKERGDETKVSSGVNLRSKSTRTKPVLGKMLPSDQKTVVGKTSGTMSIEREWLTLMDDLISTRLILCNAVGKATTTNLNQIRCDDLAQIFVQFVRRLEVGNMWQSLVIAVRNDRVNNSVASQKETIIMELLYQLSAESCWNNLVHDFFSALLYSSLYHEAKSISYYCRDARCILNAASILDKENYPTDLTLIDKLLRRAIVNDQPEWVVALLCYTILLYPKPLERLLFSSVEDNYLRDVIVVYISLREDLYLTFTKLVSRIHKAHDSLNWVQQLDSNSFARMIMALVDKIGCMDPAVDISYKFSDAFISSTGCCVAIFRAANSRLIKDKFSMLKSLIDESLQSISIKFDLGRRDVCGLFADTSNASLRFLKKDVNKLYLYAKMLCTLISPMDLLQLCLFRESVDEVCRLKTAIKSKLLKNPGDQMLNMAYYVLFDFLYRLQPYSRKLRQLLSKI